MTVRYVLKVRTVRPPQRTEVWAEPSLIRPLVYDGADTGRGLRLRCRLSICCFCFHLKFIMMHNCSKRSTWERNKLLVYYGLWHYQSVISWPKLVVMTKYQCRRRFIAPYNIMRAAMGRVNTGGGRRCVSLLVNISINVSVRTPYVRQECVLASRKWWQCSHIVISWGSCIFDGAGQMWLWMCISQHPLHSSQKLDFILDLQI